MRTAVIVAALAAASAIGPPAADAQHEGDMLIASTAAGALAIEYDFARPIVVTHSFSAGGITLYSGTEPGFDALVGDEPGKGLSALQRGTAVRCEITAIDAGVSLRIGGTTVDAVGESARIGTAPDLHVHPSWRLTLPDGAVGAYRVAFRLIGTRGYEPSIEYAATLTNEPSAGAPTPTATPTAVPTNTRSPSATPTDNRDPSPTTTATAASTATATPDPGECPSDCNGDRRIAVNEIVTAVAIALGTQLPALCPSADTDLDGSVTISELVRAVAAALNGCPDEA